MLELLEEQHKLTANQWKIALAATIGDMLDFFDFGLIAFVLAFIVKDWHLTFGESGLILLASGITAPRAVQRSILAQGGESEMQHMAAVVHPVAR
jgi:hypothetical protein